MTDELDRKTLVRGVAALSGGRLGAAVISAVWLIFVARMVGPAAFGELSVVLGVGAVAGVFADLGLPFVLSAEVARAGECSLDTVRYVQRRRLAGAALAAAATVGVHLALVEDPDPRVSLWFAIALSGAVWNSTMYAALRGVGNTTVEGGGEFGARILTVAIGGPLLLSGGGIVGVAAAYALANVAVLVVADRMSRRCLVQHDNIDRSRFLLRLTAGTSLARIVAAGQRRADIAVVTSVGGVAVAGLYSAPFRLFESLLVPARSFGALEIGRGVRKRPLRSALQAGALTAIPAAMVAALAPTAIPLLFGSDYRAAISVSQVLMLAVVPAAVSSALLPRWSVERGWVMSVVLVVVTLSALAADVPAVGHHGALGAAWVTVGSEFVIAAILVWLSSRRERNGQPQRQPSAGLGAN